MAFFFFFLAPGMLDLAVPAAAPAISHRIAKGPWSQRGSSLRAHQAYADTVLAAAACLSIADGCGN